MTSSVFKHRRAALMQALAPNSAAIIPATPRVIRNRDVYYPYRPDSDFYYLSGFPEPDAVAVLIPGRTTAEYVLFCQERDERKELWDGPIIGPKRAVNQYAAATAFPLSQLDARLPELLQSVQHVYYAIGRHADWDQRLSAWVNSRRGKTRNGAHGAVQLIDLDQNLHELRLIKDAAEIDSMAHAADISAIAHRRVMQVCHPGLHEYALEAEFTHACVSNGARHAAYVPIVGGGANGCVLHYNDNQAVLNDGDLVLIDAGAESDYYAADITRTFPVNGRFSPPQRDLYELVLAAQAAALKKVKPGNHWNDPHQAAVRVLTRGLVELKILRGAVNTLIRTAAYKPFYMHRTGHWLGMDVHDVGDYQIEGKWRQLVPGMCLTVEPGLYIAPEAKGVAKHWRGIGIRIEDDVVVTTAGNRVLTDAAPKSIAAIETLMAQP